MPWQAARFLACMRLLRDIELECVRRLMKAADVDGDGTLDVTELPELLHGLGYEPWDLQVINEALEDAGLFELGDSPQLGLGDVWRFLIEYRRREGFSRRDLRSLQQVFHQQDQDNSGELDNLEAPLALRKFGFAVGFNEVQSWLLKVDVDESGALNIVEFHKLARMLQSSEMNRFRTAFRAEAKESKTLSSDTAVIVLARLGYDASIWEMFLGEKLSESQFLTLCFRFLQMRREECLRNEGWDAKQMQWLKNVFKNYDTAGSGYIARQDLIRLLVDVLPNMSRDPLFRPQLRAILRQVQVETTGRLSFHDFQTFLQLCRTAQEKTVARRQHAAMEETGFSQAEAQEFRDLFLSAGQTPGCINFEEIWKMLNSTTPLGHNLTLELLQMFNEQLMKRSEFYTDPELEHALDFADFLRFMRNLMDINFAHLIRKV
ncbi:unnamed protein product [Effrenium voratum]|nr:unnamed protein product [Effrenium voratum]